jgi:hypothetical protein
MSQHSTGPTGLFSDETLAYLKRVPLITMEKQQGVNATDAAGNRVFLWEEDAWAAAAKAIKAVNPAAAVIAWLDTTLIYTGWNLDGDTKTINHTFNPDANKFCANGQFRPAEFLERHPEFLLKNSTSQLAITDFGGCHVYDHTQARVRQYWRDMCLNLTQAGTIDGCGADFSAGPHNSEATNTPDTAMGFLGVNKSTAEAWLAGQRQMMIDTMAALGGGLLMGKAPGELGDHVNGVLHESCFKRNSTIITLRNLTQRSRATGQRLVYQCHLDMQYLNNDTLASFLIGAGKDHYMVTGSFNFDDDAAHHWSPMFDNPLGAPQADAVYDTATATWTRSFASGTHVSFNAKTQVGTIQWGNAAVGA